ncbi:pyrroline-5-carboxylate reductase [Paenibacillus urinalis]|uniref:Pyrroline-5-carboxylate reductase n=1 Tax=Paenibacillus urinalis TaxID=521520 RepID=A0AAX3MXR2_9BACL|nr:MULTISPECIES: pyrroline-5-carboxylate reductase [Paenibacillus]WDH81187.1 pyrroline-5-carboxylate reductase [Paenibacillus urinalis]WDH97239.1 pyrroline-5-carboxylate reductase [Paenibacillus urinalis]WDI00902.1 pyrroline-5-carboxylate reductase [Paenibacillus urinalis]GAK40057.1 pyrroline-5-carboxylate reductase 1 [Paenibacillus sp. TCA20]
MSGNQFLINRKITFFGAGAMAEAIAKGLIARKVVSSEKITMFNRSNQDRLTELQRKYNVTTAADAASKEAALTQADLIILSMKPKDAAESLRYLGPLLSKRQVVVSVIAGLTIETIQSLLGRTAAVVRTMPNTSSSIGLGATGIAFSPEVTDEDRQIVNTVFEAIGTITLIEEEQFETLTGISGSGPAYIYYMMEAMVEAGVRGGLTAEQAHDLTVQTVLGAARMVQLTGEAPATLRKNVTSPNGSTQAAIEVMAKGHFNETVIAAVQRCAERSREMGEELKEAAR